MRYPPVFCATLATAFAVAPTSAQVHPLRDAFIALDRAHAERGYDESSLDIYSVLPQGATGKAVFPLQSGVTYAIRTLCDGHCDDLESALYDPDGRVAARDTSGSRDGGSIWFTPAYSQTYVLHVTMVGCNAAQCYWGAKSYQPTTAEAVRWGQGHAPQRDNPPPRPDTGEGTASGEAFMGANPDGRLALDGHFAVSDNDMGRIGFYPFARRVGGRLATGGTARRTIRLDGGHDYVIYPTCNIHCTASTARLYDGDREVASESQPGGAWIEYHPTRTGGFTVEFEMTRCTAADCPWGMKPYQAERYAHARANMVNPDAAYMAEVNEAEETVAEVSEADETELGVYTPVASGLGPGVGSVVIEGELAKGDSRDTDGVLRDAYAVQARAGQTLRAEVRAEGFQPYLFVYPPTGYGVDSYDWEDPVDRSDLELEITEAGEWHVLVTARERSDLGMTGSYRLVLTLSAGAAKRR